MPKKLIEVALPLEAINAAAGREKSIRHGHPSTLHLWWARRPLAAARAVLFAQLVDDPSTWPELQGDEAGQKRERERLFRLIERMVPWEASHDEAIINEARREIAQSHARFHRDDPRADVILGEKPAAAVVNQYLATALPPVHDPFAGGGTIPLEAQRLGLRAIATDLNPVAVLINKALIEIPPKFAGQPPVNPESQRNQKMRTWKGAEGLAEDVRYYGTWMRDEAFKRIGHLYPKVTLSTEHGGGEATVIAWLWARTVKCPNPACNATAPLIRSLSLATKPGKEYHLVADPKALGGRGGFRVEKGAGESVGTVRARSAYCLACKNEFELSYVREEAQAGRMGSIPTAIVAEGKRARIYLSSIDSHASIAASAQSHWRPSERVTTPSHDVDRLPMYGMYEWADAFTPRQLNTLATLSGLVEEVRAEVLKDVRPLSDPAKAGYGEAIAVFLSFAVDRLVNYSSMLCSWHSGAKYETITSTFARQALTMTWDYAEGNPFSESSGNFISQVDGVYQNLLRIPADLTCLGRAFQADACEPGGPEGVVVSTDPPYYDNIGYADLSDFFYVWLRRSVGLLYPNLFATITVPKNSELVASQHRHGGDLARAKDFFEEKIRIAFGRIYERQVEGYPLAVYYAFKQVESDGEGDAGGGVVASSGWETMLSSLLGSGFVVHGTWPVRTELTGNIKKHINALASSIVLVCRKRADDAPSATRSDFLRALKRTLPRDLKLLQQGNIAPVDFAQAAIGPGMAVFSSYAKVLESDGSAMSVRTALQIINQVLDEVLSEQEGDFDADTRCALAWFEQHQYGEAEFGSADTLARAKNTSVAGLVEAGVLRSSRGKVALLTRAELSADWDPATDARRTVWEVAQHLIRALEAKGERAAGELLARVGAQGEAARELAYRLYSLCERKKWAAEALAYNGLVTAWPEVAKLAAAAGEASSVAETPAQRGLPGMG